MKTLLQVEDSFLIQGRGLVVTPLLPVPPDGLRFQPFSDAAVVRRPDGSEQRVRVQFALEHFSLTGGGSRWSLVAMLPAASKHDIPVGSTLLITEEASGRLGH